MAGKRVRADAQLNGEAWLLRDAWEWADDAARLHGLSTSVLLLPTTRKGIWKVRATVVPVEHLSVVMGPHAYQTEYPGPVARSLASTIFQAMVQLDKLRAAGRRQDELPF